ncbi:hypothetical protein A3F27_02180 [Candidatus Kaiserbacteria bacterium RIFCSPHIGHO2_12_FULL_53_13]|uniref:EamA domain-containing protein n=1 Tax=Candidatus Kaiserbacteria bacterium RIFCSPHIGHO2_12_FULL_53_13 TaxID=1798502 RepID=A0A1F6EBS6_9BACT|nr:MAG: hypothetical protein A3F27_02180 [Candidatus Kaiserbacteria bacterium RIFCSPHIGHO2_12_FULL_53_13]OGG74705.1 MAG: hypothetical protein A3A37_02470 [Candidatus Kaiserbacteria bacterium RIFCSPLOWO2_01_FULL_52_36]
MLGILLAAISSAFDEITDSTGKKKISDGLESYYTFGFLTQFLSALFITAIGFLFADLNFSLDSLETFIPRVIIAILELQLAVSVIARVDRGSFGFIRLATIPLLLVADLVLGYPLASTQILGIILIIIPIGILFYFDLSKSRGMLLVLLVAILAAIDTGLYKYDISHFNSVESEQAIISLIISLYFFLTATLIRGENPLAFLRQKIYMAQASSSGIAYVVGSFAYLYASASVITAARRGFSVLFSILTGTFYFKERGFFVRTLLFIIILIGLMLLI